MVEDPDSVPGEQRIRSLDEAAAQLTDHHDRLMETVERLSTMTEDPVEPDAARTAVDDALRWTGRTSAAAERLRQLVTELGPEAATGRVDELAVAGTVTDGEEPVEGVTVRAYDRDLDGEQLLGEATTSSDGRYRITYRPSDFEAAERMTADLVVYHYTPLI